MIEINKEFFTTLFLTVFNILILYFVLKKLLFKPVSKYMENRTNKIKEALDMAAEAKLDLALVSPNAQPPVCKLMNYGKYKFEQAKREKESKKNQKTFELKELRGTPNIEQHDFEFKAKNARKFLQDGNKVKITVRFRGRELNYVKAGEETLNEFIENLSDIATVEKKPLLEGKNMFVILAKKVEK